LLLFLTSGDGIALLKEQQRCAIAAVRVGDLAGFPGGGALSGSRIGWRASRVAGH
jgi:hypothetical protein